MPQLLGGVGAVYRVVGQDEDWRLTELGDEFVLKGFMGELLARGQHRSKLVELCLSWTHPAGRSKSCWWLRGARACSSQQRVLLERLVLSWLEGQDGGAWGPPAEWTGVGGQTFAVALCCWKYWSNGQMLVHRKRHQVVGGHCGGGVVVPSLLCASPGRKMDRAASFDVYEDTRDMAMAIG